jgi:hypothetical protein
MLIAKQNKDFYDYYKLLYIYNNILLMKENLPSHITSILSVSNFDYINENLLYYYYIMKYIFVDRVMISNFVIDLIDSKDQYDILFNKLFVNNDTVNFYQKDIIKLLYLN